MRRADSRPGARRPSAWGWVVTVSACLVVGSMLALAAGWAASSERRIATYAVRGPVTAMVLDLGAADAEIVGGGGRTAIEVRRTDRFAFGQDAVARRDVSGGVLRIRSRCPATVLGSCSTDYRVAVPNNIPVTIRTGSGDVRFEGYRGSAQVDTGAGDITVGAFCGFTLRARAGSGDVRATAACATERLELRSRTGDVRATVPEGRYRVDAVSDAGRRRVEGITAADDAPFTIQALSSTGDVIVQGGA